MVSRFSLCAFAVVLLAVAGLRGCSRDDGPQVVLYASADEFLVRDVIGEFEKQTGTRVLYVGDTEAQKTAGLVNRLRSEKDNPQADVFWSSEPFLTIKLAEEGVLAPHESDELRDWPAKWRDADRRWHGFAARARVIVYSTERIPADEVPTTWMALTQERWKGRLAMADPRFGTTGGHLAAMREYWTRTVGAGFYEAFLMGLADNSIMILPGNGPVVDAIIRGEADIGMTDTDDVWVRQAQGAKVAAVYARHEVDPANEGGGTLMMPNTVARISGGPNPAHAAALINFLLSDKVERMLSQSASHNIPLRPGLAEAQSPYLVTDPLDVHLHRAADGFDQAIDLAVQLLMTRESDDAQ
jgi:iron(III) transport system substrate-binding protein